MSLACLSVGSGFKTVVESVELDFNELEPAAGAADAAIVAPAEYPAKRRRHPPDVRFTPPEADIRWRARACPLCAIIINSSGLRNSAVTPGSLTAIGFSLGLERVTHRNAVRSIDATQVYRASRLYSGGRVATCSMHATGGDAGGRIQGRHDA